MHKSKSPENKEKRKKEEQYSDKLTDPEIIKGGEKEKSPEDELDEGGVEWVR